MPTAVKQPYTTFLDIDGDPLDGGYIYIGTAGLEPEANQIQVYFDSDLTIPATQPIRTNSGYTVNSGSPASIYCATNDYSISVRNKNNTIVTNSLYASNTGGASITGNYQKTFTSIANMKSDTSSYAGAMDALSDGGRSGDFITLSGNFISAVAADPLEGVYIAFDDDPTGATKVRKREPLDYVTSEMFGGSLNAAIAFGASNGVKVIGGNVTSADIIELKSGLNLELESLDVSDADGIFVGGDFGRNTMTASTFYPCANAVVGNKITLNSAGNASNFSVGGFCFIRGGSYYTTGSDDIYHYGHFDTITAISGADIYIRHPITENFTSASICNPGTGVKDANVSIKTLRSTSATIAKMFREGGGMVDCTFNIGRIACDSVIFTNSWNSCEVDIMVAECIRHFYELGLNSRLNNISIKNAIMMGIGVSGKRPIRTSENSYANTVNVEVLSLPNYIASDTPVYVEGRKNLISIGEIDAPLAPLQLIKFASQAFTPTPQDVSDNIVEIGEAVGGGGTEYFDFDDTSSSLSGNIIRGRNGHGRFFGAVSSRAGTVEGDSSELESLFFEHGKLFVQSGTYYEQINKCNFPEGINAQALANSNRYKGNKFGLADQAIALSKYLTTQTVNSTSTANKVYDESFPAFSLIAGDVIEFKIYGEITGTTDTKHMNVMFGGDTVCQVDTLSTDVGHFSITGEIYLSSITTDRSMFNISLNSDSQSAANSISSIESNATAISVGAYVANAADTILLHGVNINIKKVGF